MEFFLHRSNILENGNYNLVLNTMEEQDFIEALEVHKQPQQLHVIYVTSCDKFLLCLCCSNTSFIGLESILHIWSG